jgi:hypothetical protein
VAEVVLAVVVVTSRWGPQCLAGGACKFFVLENFLCRESYGALGTSLPRVGPVALGTERQ